MAAISKFEDLPIWILARDLCKKIYLLTGKEPLSKDYRFVQQLRAASGSIMDNIAEGFERDNNREFIHFLYIAKGSAGEVRSQLYRAFDAGYLEKEDFFHYCDQAVEISQSISQFIKYLQSSEIQGFRKLNL